MLPQRLPPRDAAVPEPAPYLPSPQLPRATPRDLNLDTRPLLQGQPAHRLDDLYHQLLTPSWPRLLGLVLVAYLVLNLGFALLFLAGGDSIASAEPGSLVDAFFFSVQTFATIGYGSMAPQTLYAHVLVTAEALVGMLTMALTTGLLFTKCSRPTSKVVFAEVAVVNARDGVPHLQFRMANQRGNQIVHASVKAALARNERTAEGEVMRRFHDLRFVRSETMIFALTWTAMHPIDEQSPLWGYTDQDLLRGGMEIVVALVGTDDVLNQTIHARWSYRADEVRWGHRYVDILGTNAQGRRTVDYRLFHQTVALMPVSLQSDPTSTSA